MTREQATEILKAYRYRLVDAASNQLDGDIEAFDMAIQALQTDGDLVSRQALLKLMGEEPFNWTDSDKELQAVEDYRGFRNMVEQLPSVKPKDVLVIRSTLHVPLENMRYWHKKILEDIKTGVVILPYYLFPEIVPADVEIKFEGEDKCQQIHVLN